MSTWFDTIKSGVSYLTSTVAERIFVPSTLFLAKNSFTQDLTSGTNVSEIAQKRFNELSGSQKGEVYGKVWELAKMRDPRIGGERWGETHIFEDSNRLASALHRLGFLSDNRNSLHAVSCLPFSFGEGGIGSQYFSLSERLDRNPLPGHVGYVNGMGVPSLEHAGRDAAAFSDLFVDGNNLHCVYHATHQVSPSGDQRGFAVDALRMKAVDGGSYTKTSYLIAQQWLDFLNEHPNQNYLQIAHSEGAVHVNAALRLIQQARPELLSRLRVITFCPAHFISPETYPGLQVINLVKKEDGVINPWGANASQIGSANHIRVVNHTKDHPHNHLSDDYRQAGKAYVDTFMRSGNIL